MDFLLRDFVETADGLIFALVAGGVEDDRVIGFLRYVRQGDGLKKVDTDTACRLLRERRPEYLHYSERRDAVVHGVPVPCVVRHHSARRRLGELLSSASSDPVEADARRLCTLFEQEGFDLDYAGITGSLLVGAQGPASDIDLVIYGRDRFHDARAIIRRLQERGDLDMLDDDLWQETYRRRGCTLGFEEYVWHERRKFNKGAIHGRKFDIGPAQTDPLIEDPRRYRKVAAAPATIRARVCDGDDAFGYPARYRLDHPEVTEALCFTPTYAGQAFRGETIEVRGFVEQAEDGGCRIVVGSSREAPGEYIRVVSADGG